MNLWARMLADVPATLQRLVARRQRVSLPHGCSAHERQLRLRQSLCHARIVRITYATLEPECQAALQALRARRGGISPLDLEAHYGPIRPWRVIECALQPQSVAEQLVLLGWLLPRPATPRHPAHYLLPPEVRRWLPQPLCLTDYGHALAVGPAPIGRAATTILLACAERPLLARADGSLRMAAVRLLGTRLAPMPQEQYVPLIQWVLPLLVERGCVAQHGGGYTLSPAGQRFLARAPHAQYTELRDAWLRAPEADGWLVPLLDDRRGIDWSLLRHRLCAWVEALPMTTWLDPATVYDQLAATFGPLADAHTHGFREVRRVPWQPRRAAAIFRAALEGPFTWLGMIGWSGEPGETERRCARMPGCRLPGEMEGNLGHGWHYGAPGQVVVPHASSTGTVLRLLPHACWQMADGAGTTYTITAASIAHGVSAGWSSNDLASIAHGVSAGWSSNDLWTLLEAEIGPAPVGWGDGLRDVLQRGQAVTKSD